MSKSRPTYQQLEKRLAAIEPIVEAIKRHEVDAVIGEEKIAFMLLRGVGEALHDSDAELRALFELSGVGLFRADTPAFRFTRVNRKFCEMTGYSAEELLTQTYIGLTSPHDRRRDMGGLARILRGKTDSWSIEKSCVRKDGNLIRVRVDATAVRNDAGQVVRIMAMVSDAISAQQAGQEPSDRSNKPRTRSVPESISPRRKKTSVKVIRISVRSKSPVKPRLKR